MRPTTRFCTLGVLCGLLLTAAAVEAQDAKVQMMLQEYTEGIETELGLRARGLSRPAHLAISYSHRGKVYLFFVKQPAKAVDDLTAALAAFQEAAKAAPDSEAAGIAEAHLLRGRAYSALGQRTKALADLAQSVEGYERLVQLKREETETLLVYALKSRIEILSADSASKSDLTQALADIQRAEPLLEKWAAKDEKEKFFAGELSKLRDQRTALEKRAAVAADQPAASTTVKREAEADPKGEDNSAERKVRFEKLTAPQAAESQVHVAAISANGRVIVGHLIAGEKQQAFRWDAEKGLQELGDLEGGSVKSAALDVSADGSVIVGYGTVSEGGGDARRAFRWTAEEGLKPLGAHGVNHAVDAVAVSANGRVVAGHLGDRFNPRLQAFTWTAEKKFAPVDSTIQIAGRQFDGVSHIHGLSPNGMVAAGSMGMQGVNFNNACLWIDGFGAAIHRKEFEEGAGNLPGFVSTSTVIVDLWTNPQDVVEAIVGQHHSKKLGKTRGFRIANKKFSWLQGGEGELTWPTAMSRDGEVIVGAMSQEESGRAAAWKAGYGVVSLTTLLKHSGVELPEGELIDSTGVSADGKTVVGIGKDGEGKTFGWRAVWSDDPFASVPKPKVPQLPGLRVGAIWKGECSQLGKRNYPMELTITAIDGNEFEGTTWFPSFKGAAHVRGTVNGATIKFQEYKLIKGSVAIPCDYESTLAGKRMDGIWSALRQRSPFYLEFTP